MTMEKRNPRTQGARAPMSIGADVEPSTPVRPRKPILKLRLGQPAQTSRSPEDHEVRAYLRRQGIADPISEQFVRDLRWHAFSVAASKALEETDLYPAGAAGAKAFLNDLMQLVGRDPAIVSATAPVRIVSKRIGELMKQRFAGREAIHG